MIEARKLAGITNMSNYTNKMAQIACFANETTGDKAKLIVVVGNNTKHILQVPTIHRFSKDTTTVIIFLNLQKPHGATFHQANMRQVSS